MKINIESNKLNYIAYLPNILLSFARKRFYIDIFLFKKCWLIGFNFDD